jgi:hypothetical protein
MVTCERIEELLASLVNERQSLIDQTHAYDGAIQVLQLLLSEATMGQPIKLVKGNETLTVYGSAQAAVHIAQGWQLEGVAAQIEADEAVGKAASKEEESKSLEEEVMATEMLTIVDKPAAKPTAKPKAKK